MVGINSTTSDTTSCDASTDTNGLDLYIKYGFYFEPINTEAYEKLSIRNKKSYDHKLKKLNNYLEQKRIKEEAVIAKKLISEEKAKIRVEKKAEYAKNVYKYNKQYRLHRQEYNRAYYQFVKSRKKTDDEKLNEIINA
jgi:hypothetical protein